MKGLVPRSAHRNVRVYRSLRSAHLERAHATAPASILYTRRRDDFDENLVDGVDIIQGNAFMLFCTLLRSDLELIEINEPLMRDGLLHGLGAVVAAGLSGLIRRRRVSIVTYAIENRNPFQAGSGARVRTRLNTMMDQLLATIVGRRSGGLRHRRLGRHLPGAAGLRTA